MYKTLWMFVCVIFVAALFAAPLTLSSTRPDQPPAAASPDNPTDWCCIAGLSCCIKPPTR
jgi:hypothetical protein